MATIANDTTAPFVRRLRMTCDRCRRQVYTLTITPAAPNEHLCMDCAGHAADAALAREAAQEAADRRAVGYPF